MDVEKKKRIQGKMNDGGVFNKALTLRTLERIHRYQPDQQDRDLHHFMIQIDQQHHSLANHLATTHSIEEDYQYQQVLGSSLWV
jgi:hypothetical protein